MDQNDISVTKFLDAIVDEFLATNDISVTKFLEGDNDISVTKFLHQQKDPYWNGKAQGGQTGKEKIVNPSLRGKKQHADKKSHE
jgi:hypothetical protein